MVAQTGIVDEGYARDPVAVVHLAIALDVVLASGKVPHEVAPIHVVELVVDEEVEVFGKGGLVHQLLLYRIAVAVDIDCGFDRRTLISGPIAVLSWVAVEIVVDTGEEHIELRSHGVGLLAACHGVGVGLGGSFLTVLAYSSAPSLTMGVVVRPSSPT